MGTITVSVATAQGTVNVTKTVSDPDISRLVDAMGSYLDGEFNGTDKDGNPLPVKTTPNIIRAWVKNWLASSVRLTKSHEASLVAVSDLQVSD